MSEPFSIADGPRADGCAILRLRGRMDATTAQQLLARCAEIHAEGLSLVLNLAYVTFVSSTGIGALLTIAEDIREQGGGFRLAAVPEHVRAVFDMLDLTTCLNVDETESGSLA